jgi:hypothetical protein
MTPTEAADKIRPDFHLESMPPEDRHHVKFIEDVASELGVEHTPFNLHQVGQALDRADIHPDSNEYPKMLYSRTHHAEEGVGASVYEPRHDFVWAHVANEDEAKKLGSGWVEDISELPPRGEIPLHAEPKAVEHAPVVEHEEPPFETTHEEFIGE